MTYEQECELKRMAEREYNNKMQSGALLGMAGQCVAESVRPVAPNDYIVKNHNPTPPAIQRIETIRAAALNFLNAIDSNCPNCADSSAAKRKVREAMMTANAAIALDGAV